MFSAISESTTNDIIATPCFAVTNQLVLEDDKVEKESNDLAINSRLLLNSDKSALEKLFLDLDIDPAAVDDMMSSVQEWYKKEPHLPVGQLHDQFIARLLVMRKFSIEQVKQKIDNYYTVRPKAPEFLCNRDPMNPDLNMCIKNGYWTILPRKTKENHRVTLFRLKNNDVAVLDLVKVIFMMVDYRMFNDSVLGEQIILDYSNVTLALALQLTPVIISKIIYYFTECLGPNIKAIYVINLPPFAEYILILAKKILKPKLVKRIHILKDLDEVLRKFPDSIIPKDLGGTDDVTCQDIANAWEKTLSSKSWRNHFLEQDSIHTDETKRTSKNNFLDDFGLDGSFKRLNVD